MSAAVRLDAMILAARQRAGQETLDQSQALVTDSEATSHLNYFLQEIYGELIRAQGQNYYRAQSTFSTSNGVDTYVLPAQFVSLLSVDWRLSNSEVVPVRNYMEAERNRYRVVAGWYRNQPIAFQLQGSNIKFIPTPQGSYVVEVNYVPAFTPLVNAGDLFDGVAGFEDYAIFKLAALMCSKDADEVRAAWMDKEADRILVRVRAMKVIRSGEPPRVQRVRKARRLGWVE